MNSHSASSQRVEKLRKARNINEIVAVLKDIALSIKSIGPKADKFIEAVSSAQSLKGRNLQDVIAAYSTAVDPVHANSRLIISPELTRRFQASQSSRTTRVPNTGEEVSFIRDGLNKLDFTPTADRADPEDDKYELKPKAPRTKRATGVQVVPLKKFVKPSTTTLVQNNEVLNQLLENVQELKYAIQLLEQGFEEGPQRDAALKASKLLFKSADDRIAAAFDVLDNLAVRHMPTPMNQIAKAMVKHLSTTVVKGRYKDVSEYCHVANYGTSGAIIFSFYHVFHELKSDSGFVFDKYYVVLTGIVENRGLRLYINTMPDFKLPGRYPLGTEVSNLTPAKINIYADEFLAQNDVSVELERQTMPIDKARIKTSGMLKIPGVKSMYVFDDGFRVSLKPEYSAPEKHALVAAPVMLRLNRLLGNKGKSKVAYKTHRNGNTIMLEFVMINSSGLSKKLSKSGLSEIQDALGLTDAQVNQIRVAQRETD